MVEVPFHPVGQHADVAGAQLRDPVPHVAGELTDRVLANVADPQVSLDLEHRRADLDVDPAALADGCLEHDLLEMLFQQVQPGSQQQQPQVALHGGLSPARYAVDQPGRHLRKVDHAAGHRTDGTAKARRRDHLQATGAPTVG